jgi:hypothetical protein
MVMTIWPRYHANNKVKSKISVFPYHEMGAHKCHMSASYPSTTSEIVILV